MTATLPLRPQRYVESLAADNGRMIALGAQGVSQPVPACAPWTVADLLRHVATVYEHKVRIMADGEWPTDWPPADFAQREPVEFLRKVNTHLFAEFNRHQPADPAPTFVPYDKTYGFWLRRMAQEAVVHRVDVEQAHGAPSAVATDVALDGVDELCRAFLEVEPGEGEPATHPVDAAVAIEADGHRWRCVLAADSAVIEADSTASAAATVSGEPGEVHLWLWGRRPDSAVTLAGDASVLAAFRARLAECTQ